MRLGCIGCGLLLAVLFALGLAVAGALFLSVNLFLEPDVVPSRTFTRGEGYAAQNKLFEIAHETGARLTLTVAWAVRPSLPRPMTGAEIIRKQLAAVGIHLSIVETKSSDDFMTTLATGRFDLALAGWIADTTDPADYYEALFWSRSIGDENGSNNSRWNDPKTDAALARFRVQPSEENRREIETIVRDEAPLVPLIYGQSTVIHARRLRNVTISPIGILPLNDISM